MKNKTQAAQAAALIRKEIKAAFPDLKFRCTSDNYAGGSSVNVYYQDQPRAVHEAIKDIIGKYQYGHFDGMTDMYEYTNTRDDLPQAKYVFANNELTEAKREELYQVVKVRFMGGDALPPTYDEARRNNAILQGMYIDQMVYRQFTEATGAV